MWIENNCKTTVSNCGFMVILIKKYFKNNIKITTPLKQTWIKNNYKTTVTNYGFKGNCKTTVCNCGFKDIFVTFKTTVTNGGFLHLKNKNQYGCLRE